MTSEALDVSVSLATAPSPGAVGLLVLSGQGVGQVLARLTGVEDWPAGKLRLVDLGGVDQGLAVRLRDDWAQVMPHGGPRVVGKLIDRIAELGAVYDANPNPGEVYPEAATKLEADMLACVARAASPAAIDLLFAQPVLWRQWLDTATSYDAGEFQSQARAILQRSDRFDRLVDPPTVVVVGQPNVGKSTLTNRMLGRSASLVADLPGTTRDWVAGLAEIGHVAVRWADTPGLRDADDGVEQQAIGLARQVIEQAEVLIAMRDPSIGWPDLDTSRRCPDLWVMNKVDDTHCVSFTRVEDINRCVTNTRDQVIRAKTNLNGYEAALESPGGDGGRDTPIPISAKTGRGVDRLGTLVLEHLGLAQRHANQLWAFSPTLRRGLATEAAVGKLRGYATVSEEPRSFVADR